MRIAILGFGREGRSVFHLLRNYNVGATAHRSTQNSEIWILDENSSLKIPQGIRAQLGKNWLQNLEQFDLIVRSPGIYYQRPEFKVARKKGVAFTSSTKIFFDEIQRRFAQNKPLDFARGKRGSTRKDSDVPCIVGVTGSKGKSTISTLLYQIFKKAGRDTFLAGNIGKPALDILPRLKKSSWVILELSSFQLQDLEVSPHIAVVSDMFPEHQDIHDTIEDYYKAKTSITKYQSTGDMIFYLSGNKTTARIARGGKGKKIPVVPEKFSLFAPQDIKLNGAHQYRNATLAGAVALGLGIPAELVKKVCTSFSGLPHRIEFVRRIPFRDIRVNSEHSDRHIDFYNDSQSTNAYSVIAAARSFPKKNTVIIGGGYDKNVDYAPFKTSLKSSSLKLAVLFGQNKYKIQKGYRSAGIPTKIVPDLKSAVSAAYAFARELGTWNLELGTSIILSPGTSSFDMFKNYTERGEKFKELVKKLS